jgi:hypothetical protein
MVLHLLSEMVRALRRCLCVNLILVDLDSRIRRVLEVLRDEVDLLGHSASYSQLLV